jgi:hypothetical protein
MFKLKDHNNDLAWFLLEFRISVTRWRAARTLTHKLSLSLTLYKEEDEGVSKQKQEKHFRLISIILGTWNS